MNDLINRYSKTRVRFPTAPQNMKNIIKKFLTFIENFRKLKTRKTHIIDVYSADTNKIDEDGGPYKVEVMNVRQKTR